MKIRTKWFILLIALVVGSLLLTACAPADTTTPTSSAAVRTPVRVAALKGPTGMGLVKLMADQDAQKTANDYTFSLTSAPDDIVAQLSSGQVDIAALPTNLAAVLYQRTDKAIRMLAVNTLGVLYILEKGNTVNSLADLAGKELLASGQGAVPEYVINDLIAGGNLAKPVQITYKAEHDELSTLAASGMADLVMLPEPFVTTVLSKNADMRVALDLTAEWKKIHQDGSELAMGCLVVTSAFVEAHPDALQVFLSEYQVSTDYVNAQPDAAGELIAQYKILGDAKLAAKSIPNCHIVLIRGTEMKDMLQPFYAILFAANGKSVGGALPDDAFYWMP